jgi:hypothetical protein
VDLLLSRNSELSTDWGTHRARTEALPVVGSGRPTATVEQVFDLVDAMARAGV